MRIIPRSTRLYTSWAAIGSDFQLTTLNVVAPAVTLCEGKKETISCEVGKKIKILDAFYGRREQKLCKGLIEIVLPGIDCSTANALDITKEECEGMQSCELHAVSDEYGNPCLLNSEYLKV